MARIVGTAGADSVPGKRNLVWAAPIALLVGIGYWLAFSSGGYPPRQWAIPTMVLGLFGVAAAAAKAYPRRPRQLSLAVLALFGAYSIWVACSAIWATSASRVWLESGRTFGYLLILALALTYFTSAPARTIFRYLLMAGTLALLFVCIGRLWSAQDLSALFSAGRLQYPTGYANSAAALFLVCFWPLMWLAAGPGEHAPVRGIAVGTATGLVGLAILTQSRGAIYSLAITLVLMFILSPARIRLLFYLLVPALFMGYAFPRLNRYWLEGPQNLGGGQAARTLLLTALAAGFIGMMLALLERWIRVTARMKAVFGGVIAAACLAGLVYGAVTLTTQYEGPGAWAAQTWHQFTASTATGRIDGARPSPATSDSRLTDVSANGRLDLWKAAWHEFSSSPVVGAGAGNFVYAYSRPRAVGNPGSRQADSITLQILGDTGIIGGLFAFGAIILAVCGILWPRFSAGWSRARRWWLRHSAKRAKARAKASKSARPPSRWGDDPSAYGWEMALVVGAACWFIHANVEWLWQMPGVSIPAVLMLAAAVASVDARAGVLWPRIEQHLRWKRSAKVVGHGSADRVGVGTADTAETAGGSGDRSDHPKPPVPTGPAPRRTRQKTAGLMRLDDGPLPLAFRIGSIVLSVVVLVLAEFAFFSVQLQTSARVSEEARPTEAQAVTVASSRAFDFEHSRRAGPGPPSPSSGGTP